MKNKVIISVSDGHKRAEIGFEKFVHKGVASWMAENLQNDFVTDDAFYNCSTRRIEVQNWNTTLDLEKLTDSLFELMKEQCMEAEFQVQHAH